MTENMKIYLPKIVKYVIILVDNVTKINVILVNMKESPKMGLKNVYVGEIL